MFKQKKAFSLIFILTTSCISCLFLFIIFAFFVPGWLRFGPPGSYLINRRILEFKADSGDREAMYQVAEEYSKIKMSYRDFDLAKEWYLKAAEHGHPKAIGILANTEGWVLWNRKWMDIGVKLKVESCLYRSAQAYDFGAGGYPKNSEMTKILYAECDRISLLRKKLPYTDEKRSSLNGIEVEEHFDAYRRNLESKFSSNNPRVALSISELYGGLDNNLSIQWLRRGADLDSACAYRLADFYQRGACGLPEDKDAFYRWFLHARELEKQNCADAAK
jgi:TPR repeat protein